LQPRQSIQKVRLLGAQSLKLRLCVGRRVLDFVFGRRKLVFDIQAGSFAVSFVGCHIRL
jgi:hypothetical protein